jgi:hypothetical protein
VKRLTVGLSAGPDASITDRLRRPAPIATSYGPPLRWPIEVASTVRERPRPPSRSQTPPWMSRRPQSIYTVFRTTDSTSATTCVAVPRSAPSRQHQPRGYTTRRGHSGHPAKLQTAIGPWQPDSRLQLLVTCPGSCSPSLLQGAGARH